MKSSRSRLPCLGTFCTTSACSRQFLQRVLGHTGPRDLSKAGVRCRRKAHRFRIPPMSSNVPNLPRVHVPRPEELTSRNRVVIGPVPKGVLWQHWIEPTAVAHFRATHPNITFARNASELQLKRIASRTSWPGSASSVNCTCAARRDSRRVAHIISQNPRRLRVATAVLQAAGFATTHITPVQVSDPRVLALERRYHLKNDQAPPWDAISNLLTHVDLWHAAPASGEEWAYIFEDDVALDSEIQAGEVQCLIDQIESFQGNHSLIFLGSSAEQHKKGHPQPLSECRGHAHIACAPLALHAYAVRQSSGSSLWELARYTTGPLSDVQHYQGYRYTIDIALRAFYWRAADQLRVLKAELEWPRCLDVRRHGIFHQNSSADTHNALAHNWTAGFF